MASETMKYQVILYEKLKVGHHWVYQQDIDPVHVANYDKLSTGVKISQINFFFFIGQIP